MNPTDFTIPGSRFTRSGFWSCGVYEVQVTAEINGKLRGIVDLCHPDNRTDMFESMEAKMIEFEQAERAKI